METTEALTIASDNPHFPAWLRAACKDAAAKMPDAERYRKLCATGKYCASSIGGGWALSCSEGPTSKAELDAAADALPAVGAA